MASETHDLKLKIDAAAAETGAKRFKGAVNSIKRAVSQLDRDTSGAFTQLKNAVKGIPSTAKTVNDLNKAASASERLADRMGKMQSQVISAVSAAQGRTEALTASFARLGDVRGAQAATDALKRLEDAARSASSVGDLAIAKASFGADAAALERTAKSYDEVALAASRSADQQTKLATSITTATTTATAQTDRVVAAFAKLGNTSAVDKATAALAKFKAAAASAKNAAQLGAVKADFRSTISGLESTAKAEAAVAAEMAKTEKRLEANARKYDDLRNSSVFYERALADVNELEAAGVYSADAAARARDRLSQALERGTVAVGRYGQHYSYATVQLGAQLQDIVVSAQGGLPVVTTALQQGMQAAGLLQAELVRVGSGAGVLKTVASSFASMVSPISLIAIGGSAAIAMLTKLAMNLFKTDDEVKTTKDRLAELSAVIDGLGSVSQASAAQIATYLGQTFKSVSSDVQDLIDDLRQAEFGVLSHRIQQEVEKSSKELTRLGGAFEVFWADIQNPGQVDAGYLADMQKIIAASEMTYGEFQKLEKLTQDVFSAASVTEFISSLSQARSYAQDLGGPVGDAVAKALLEAAKEGGVLNRVMGEANGATVDWNSSLGGVLQTVEAIKASLSNISGTAIGNAAKVSELEALRAGKSIEEAARARDRAQKEIEWNGRLQGANIFERGAVALERQQYNAGVELDRQIDAAREAARATGRASTKTGGAGASSVTKEISDMADQLERQRLSLDAVRSGLFTTSTAADLYADALIKGDGLVSQATIKDLERVDSLAKVTEEMRKQAAVSTGDLSTGVSGSVSDAVRSGLQAGFSGSGTFAESFASTLQQRLSNVAIDNIMKGLKIDKLFDFGTSTATQTAAMQTAAATSGATIGASMVSAGGVVATQLATAISTGQATAAATGAASTAAGTGNLFSTVAGLFFEEGGISNKPSAVNRSAAPLPASMWANAPQYAEGTANTSGGIPSILHKNEAVIPLSKDRRVPVELSGHAGGGGNVITFGDTIVNVEGGDGDTDPGKIAQAINETLEARMQEAIAQATGYGGALNPRGGY